MEGIKPFIKILDGTPTDAFINDLNIFLEADSKVLKTIFTKLKLDPSKEIPAELEEISKLIPYDLDKVNTAFAIGNLIFRQLELKEIPIQDIYDDFGKLGLKKEHSDKIKALYEDFGKLFAINRLKYETIRKNLYHLSPKLDTVLYELNLRVIEDKREGNKDSIGKIPVALIVFPRLDEFGSTKLSFNATIEDLDKIITDLNKIKLKLVDLTK